MSIDLTGMHLAKLRKEAKYTVLTKDDGNWSNQETAKLANGLVTELQTLPAKPRHVIIWGEYPEKKIKEILDPTPVNFTVVTGTDNPELPWRPSF